MELIFELLFQIVVETGGEAFFRAVGAPFEKRPSSFALGMGYALFGAGAGWLSVWVLPQAFIQNPDMRLLYVAVSPLVLGAIMVAIRRWRIAEPATSDIAYFCASALFGLCFAGARHLSIY